MMNDNNDLIMTQKISNDLKCLEMIQNTSKELRSLGQMTDEKYIEVLNYVMKNVIARQNENIAI